VTGEIIAPVTRSRLVRYVERFSEHRYGRWVLAAIAFADSSFLPIPPDLLLVPSQDAIEPPNRISIRIYPRWLAADNLARTPEPHLRRPFETHLLRAPDQDRSRPEAFD
jgi:hypothetical protein